MPVCSPRNPQQPLQIEYVFSATGRVVGGAKTVDVWRSCAGSNRRSTATGSKPRVQANHGGLFAGLPPLPKPSEAERAARIAPEYIPGGWKVRFAGGSGRNCGGVTCPVTSKTAFEMNEAQTNHQSNNIWRYDG